MNRIRQTLEELGISGEPEATLTREGAFFALVGDVLVYCDERGVRRMGLRSMTRIRSDQRGTLRIETPAGTGLSVNLTGFDPEEVQPFFVRVSEATKYAKAQAEREKSAEQKPVPQVPLENSSQANQSEPGQGSPNHFQPRQPQPNQLQSSDQIDTLVSETLPAVGERPDWDNPEPYEGSVVRVIRQSRTAEQTAPQYTAPQATRTAAKAAPVQTTAVPVAKSEHVAKNISDSQNSTDITEAHNIVATGKTLTKAQARLRVWPKVLRFTAGAVGLCAILPALSYLIGGLPTTALWLLIVMLSGSIFLLAIADALEVLGEDKDALRDSTQSHDY